MTRRELLAAIPLVAVRAASHGPLRIGDDLQLFVDDYFIESMRGVSLVPQTPVSAGRVVEFDQPWEGNVSLYGTVFQDGAKYRMYYRGWSLPEYTNRGLLKPGEVVHPKNDGQTCYAESDDGIRWTKPELALKEFNGSTRNNVIWLGEGSHNFAPFLDTNPAAPASERYKAVGGSRQLYAWRSADGIRWELIRKEPILTDGAFDSLNVAFYDTRLQRYVAIYRDFRQGVRTLKRAESADFLQWSPGVWADYGGAPKEQLYTNATTPYFRAPQIYVAFPKRFVNWRTPPSGQPLSGISETVFMTSRDGVRWDRRFMEAFIRPGRDPRNWVHRTNMVMTGVVPTAPDEISIYVQRHYNFPSCHVERMTLRTDGFVAARAGYGGGELLTRPFIMEGHKMVLNYATSAAGSIRYEVLDENRRPHPGLGIEESPVIFGDEIERSIDVRPPARNERSRMAAHPVRVRFLLKDADLFSVRFV
ncbi:MAG: hypothetical protein IPM24_07610 [Bryobacterales bacterium]|nr:hypothetical protein [Bryobacterales bacterium]